MTKKSRISLRAAALVLGLGLQAVGLTAYAAPVITYSVNAYTGNAATASGSILADGVPIGIWNLNNWTVTTLGIDPLTHLPVTLTNAVKAFGAGASSGYGLPGIGLDMGVSAVGPGYGVDTFSYDVSATLTNPAYVVQGVTLLGINPAKTRRQGPATEVLAFAVGSLKATFASNSNITVTNPDVTVAAGTTTGAYGPTPMLNTTATSATTSFSIDGAAFNPGPPVPPPPATSTANKPRDWVDTLVKWKIASDAGSTMSVSTNYSGYPASNEGSAFSFNVVPLSDMSVALSGFPATASAGQTVNGVVTCTNAGPGAATNATCGVDTSKLPAGATVTCTPDPAPNPLAVGGTISCAVQYTAPSTPVTIAASTAADNEYSTSNNTASQTIGVAPADMGVSISGFPSTVTAGQTVTGTITCLNGGPGAAAAPTCNVSGLPSGATVTCTPNPTPDPLAVGSAITCEVSYTATASQTVTVTATTGATNDPNSNNNEAAQTVTGSAADMTVALSGFPANVIAGQTVTGTVTCTNTGPDAASNAICNVNGLPAGATVTCTPTSPQATLANGGTISCQVSYVAPNPLTDPVTVVGATDASNDPNTTNNTASQKVPGSVADMGVSITGFPSTVTAGQTVTGTITCLNNGPDPAASPSCGATGLPANATVTCTPNPAPATLAAGSAITCQVSYVATASQVVTVTGNTNAINDPNVANNQATQTVTGSAADMAAALQGFPSNPNPGDTVTGTLVCTNTGPDAATNAACNVSGLPTGATVTCAPTSPQATLAAGSTIVCSVSFTQPAAGQIVTMVGTTSAKNDPNALNNTVTQKLPSTVADVGVTASFPSKVNPGDMVKGSITCTNSGPDAATGVYCNVTGIPAGGTVTCTPSTPVASLAAGASITCDVTFRVPASGTLPALVAVTGGTNDVNTANNVTNVAMGIVVQPVTVPTLSQWVLLLLSGLLLWLAAPRLPLRRMK